MRPRRADVAPGVSLLAVRSPTLPPATHTNCWLLGDGPCVLVDPGCADPAEQRALADAVGELQAILLTHHHYDHTAGLEALVAATGAPVWAHAETARRIDLPVERVLSPGEALHVDDRRTPWTVLHTPGHAPGHICLVRGDLMIAGDMVAGEGTILLDPPEGHLGTYLASLGAMAALAPATLFPAHGDEITDAGAALRSIIAHRHMRTQQVREALRARAPARPLELVPTVYPELPEFAHPFAERQVLAHLEWLVEQDEITVTDDVRFTLP